MRAQTRKLNVLVVDEGVGAIPKPVQIWGGLQLCYSDSPTFSL